MKPRINRPLIDTGWRVGMPAFQNVSATMPQAKQTTITAVDGRNYTVTLLGYGRPEWTTVSR
jgi:hypothetical protein